MLRRTAPLGLCLLALVSACAGKQKNNIGITTEAELVREEAKEEPPHRKANEVSDHAVTDLNRNFFGHRASDRARLEKDPLLTELAAADGICIGEQHDSLEAHYGQYRILEGLLLRRRMRGFELGLALEMVTSADQSSLTAYADGELDLAAWSQRVRFEEQTGLSLHYYSPLLELAKKERAVLAGLGVSKELSRAVAEKGFDGLDENERRRLSPQMDLESPAHRRLFDHLMVGHPHGSGGTAPTSPSMYQAQVLWDEAMALRALDYLGGYASVRKLLIVAGEAHCHQSGIPYRMETRSGLNITNVLIAEGTPRPAEDLVAQGYDYQLVLE